MKKHEDGILSHAIMAVSHRSSKRPRIEISIIISVSLLFDVTDTEECKAVK